MEDHVAVTVKKLEEPGDDLSTDGSDICALPIQLNSPVLLYGKRSKRAVSRVEVDLEDDDDDDGQEEEAGEHLRGGETTEEAQLEPQPLPLMAASSSYSVWLPDSNSTSSSSFSPATDSLPLPAPMSRLSTPAVMMDIPEGINSQSIDIPTLLQRLPLFVSADDFEEQEKMQQVVNCSGSTERLLPRPIQGSKAVPRHFKYTFYSQQLGLVKAATLAEVAGAQLARVLANDVFWLDIWDPSAEEIRALADVFRLHLLTLEDLQTDEDDVTRQKCDVFAEYLFVRARAVELLDPEEADLYVRTVDIRLLIFGGFVVSLHRDPLEFGRTIAKRIRLLSARTGLSADWVAYAMLEDMVDQFSPGTRDLQLAVDSIDELAMVMNSNDQADMLRRIAEVRRRMTLLSRHLSATADLLRHVVKRGGHRFAEDSLIYLRDLQDHVAMLEDCVAHADDTLARAHSSYLALVSIEISHVSNRMSDVMKKLTAAASVALPWSLISGIFGMNMWVPGSGSYSSGSLWPFLFLVTLMVVMSGLTYVLGRRRGWF